MRERGRDKVIFISSYSHSPSASYNLESWVILKANLAGGIIKCAPLHLNSNGKWILDIKEVEAAITPKTRAIVLNTPHNPTGKVYAIYIYIDIYNGDCENENGRGCALVV